MTLTYCASKKLRLKKNLDPNLQKIKHFSFELENNSDKAGTGIYINVTEGRLR